MNTTQELRQRHVVNRTTSGWGSLLWTARTGECTSSTPCTLQGLMFDVYRTYGAADVSSTTRLTMMHGCMMQHGSRLGRVRRVRRPTEDRAEARRFRCRGCR